MKAILISIKPKYVAKILNGEKDIEIRKNCPKSSVKIIGNSDEPEPIDVYIYCTKNDNLCRISRIDKDRFICGKDFDIKDFPHLKSGYDGKGKVVAKFTMYGAIKIQPKNVENWKTITIDACLTADEYEKYAKGKPTYQWVVDDLKVFDKPKELKEFLVHSHTVSGIGFRGEAKNFEVLKPLARAPQSWCYIEV